MDVRFKDVFGLVPVGRIAARALASYARRGKPLPRGRGLVTVDRLEQRSLFAVTLSWAPGNLLYISGDENANDIHLERYADENGDNIRIYIDGSWDYTYPWGTIQRLDIAGAGGNDTIFIGSLRQPGNGNQPITMGVYVNGGDGDDFINTGDGDDNVHGDTGNDTIQGEAGDDALIGGAGNDWVLDHAGNNSLYGDGDENGDGGHDTIYGGMGNDWIWAGIGDDYLWGGDGGRDILQAGEGDDTLYSTDMDGDDYLDGGAGFDYCGDGGFGDTIVNCEW
jgi:Ca2+-binding RTX toxin-like protein